MKTSDSTPFGEHRRHLREHFDRVKASGRPLIVTTDGKPDAVVMSAERYEQLVEAEDLVRSLETIDGSLDDIAQGRTRPLRDALRDVGRTVGIDLHR